MELELAYKKLLTEHKLSEGSLSEDAQVGIKSIDDIIKGAKMLEKKGKTVSDSTLKKIRAIDKWTCYEIMDQVNDTDKNSNVDNVDDLTDAAKAEMEAQVKAAAEKEIADAAAATAAAETASAEAEAKAKLEAEEAEAAKAASEAAAALETAKAEEEKIRLAAEAEVEDFLSIW